MKKLMVGLAVLAMATVSFAGIDIQQTVVDLGDGFIQVKVTLVATGETQGVYGFDGSITGPMNQEYPYGIPALTVPDLGSNYALLTPEEQAHDSHFLFAPEQVAAVQSPTESADGTELSAIVGFIPPLGGPSVDLAQIVFAQGSGPIILSGQVGDAIGRVYDIYAVIVPEPITVALLGLGLGLIRRRF